MIIVQNNLRKIWVILDLSLAVIKGNLCDYYSAMSIFSEYMVHSQPIRIVIVKKCSKLLRIYGMLAQSWGRNNNWRIYIPNGHWECFWFHMWVKWPHLDYQTVWLSEELWFDFKIEPPFENDVFRIIDLFLCSLQELDGESEGSKETNEEDESYSETY